MKSKHNNIEENITILENSIMPDNENSIIFLAAHSGTGKIAFFQYLNRLKAGDKVKLKYKDKIYNYTINSIWEEEKTGYIHINKTKENQLILTTCSPKNKDKQLIIESILSK
ncbi:MAG: sortase [Tenericutes bacterium]|nr:sortase [Mycoplasmatota bacterium]